MRKRNNFIERSIAGAVSFVKESIFADEYAAKKGLLQSLDPRIKIISILMFMATALFTRNIAVVAALYVLCICLAFLSGIEIPFFLKRTWIFVPLFSLFIAIPALFSVFSPGDIVFTFNLLGLKLSVTRQGMGGAALFVMRVVTSVSFAVLMALATRHFTLLKVLGVFGVPQIFIMTLGMCYRYIYLFLEVIENTYLAIKSRAGSRIHYRRGQSVVAWNISGLWHRSYILNASVYDAMLARGYNGGIVLLERFSARRADWAWLALSAAVSVSLFILGGG